MVSVAWRAARGAATGVVATMAMSSVMLAARLSGSVDKLEPECIVEAAFERAGIDAGRQSERAAAIGAHVLYGAAMGALYGALAVRVPFPRRARGAMFGLAILAGSYEGWVPAARILPPLREMPSARQLHLTASHLVYGVVLGALTAS